MHYRLYMSHTSQVFYFRSGQKIHVVSDHASLVNFSTFTSSSTKTNRLLSILANFDLVVHAAKGRDNLLADHLSRYPAPDLPGEPSASEMLEVYRVQKKKVKPEEEKRKEQPSRERLGEEQAVDEDCTKWRALLEGGVTAETQRDARRMKNKLARVSIVDGLLCHEYRRGDGSQHWTPFCPLSMQQEMIHRAHEQVQHAGHAGTFQALREQLFWQNMHSDVKEFVRRCPVCAEVKRTYAPPAGPYKSRFPEYPFQIVSVDFSGALPLTAQKNAYVLVVHDIFSGWSEFTAVRAATARAAVAEMERSILSRFNAPEVVVSDNHQMFGSGVWRDFCTKWNIIPVTTPSHHQCGNPAERRYQDFKGLLRLFLRYEAQHKKWDEFVPEISRILRNRPSKTTGYSPAEIVLGGKIRGPQDINLALTPAEELSLDAWVQDRMERGKKMVELVRQRIAQRRQKYLEPKNRNRQQVTYKLGQQVLLKNRVQSDKAAKVCGSLAPRYKGPMRVTKVNSGEVLEVTDEHGTRVAVEAVDELLHAARCGRLPRWRARQARTLLRLIEAEPRFAANRRSEARGALRVLEEAAHDALTAAGSCGATPASNGDAPADNDAVAAGSSGAIPASDGDAPADNSAVTAAGSDDAASNDAPAGSGNAVTAAGSSGATPAATSAAATKTPAVVHRGWTLTVEWGGEDIRVAVATG
ncbi:hypothetical protein ONE63_003536 [Megalurothrips usitatus]|uniref:RNA-directed DNA polymerase n=1 Tax=Megalurothrips usitatus TaxID=439358 RepID=A0AAV7X9T0_9NEOP|nr:hypothetical protein ONE63_003536 [Megalurothrips usitatus]